MGSGTTGVAALSSGLGFLGIDLEPEHVAISRFRLEGGEQSVESLVQESIEDDPGGILSLFGDLYGGPDD